MPDRIEIVVKGHREAAMPTQPDLTTMSSPWKGFCLEQHDLPPREMPDHWVPYHIVAIALALPFRSSWFEGGREQHSGDGDVAVSSPRELRRCRLETPGRLLHLAIEPETMRRIIPDLLHGRDIELVHREGISDPVLRELVFKLQAELAAGCPTGPLVGESLCTHIAVEIAKNYSIEHIRFEHYKGGLSKPSLRRVLEYIDAFIDHDLTVDTLAKLAGLSRYHFGKMFKQSTGTTLHRYVLTRRIRRAEQLLRSSKSPLADVAAAVGFPNQSHFTTAFRQVIGTTPGEYRVST